MSHLSILKNHELIVSLKHKSLTERKLTVEVDQGCCSYQDPKTSKKCGSRFQLEIDHIKPFSYGGSNEAKNLRLLCRSHNQFFWKFKN